MEQQMEKDGFFSDSDIYIKQIFVTLLIFLYHCFSIKILLLFKEMDRN